jgi:tetraacyldisaccharide 4'-kinase
MDPESHYYRLISGEQRGLIAALCRGGLSLLSWCYGAIIRARNAYYDHFSRAIQRVPAPVISVGNLITGGTGKTPMVIWILQRLIEMHRRPAVLMRGYKAQPAGCCQAGRIVQDRPDDCDNDEAREIRRRCPQAKIVVNPDRVAGAHKAIALGCDVLVMDDGFQHRRLGRDLDIVLIDATRPFGGGHMLPHGMLREPVGSLRRADLVVITRSDQVSTDQLNKLRRRLEGIALPSAEQAGAGGLPILAASHQPVELCDQQGAADLQMTVQAAAGRRAWLFAALGNPSGFSATVERMGFEIVGRRFWPDHYAWTDADLDRMAADACAAAPDVVLTTEKDAVKLPPDRPNWPAALRVVRVTIAFHGDGAGTLLSMIRQAVERRSPSDSSPDSSRSEVG